MSTTALQPTAHAEPVASTLFSRSQGVTRVWKPAVPGPSSWSPAAHSETRGPAASGSLHPRDQCLHYETPPCPTELEGASLTMPSGQSNGQRGGSRGAEGAGLPRKSMRRVEGTRADPRGAGAECPRAAGFLTGRGPGDRGSVAEESHSRCPHGANSTGGVPCCVRVMPTFALCRQRAMQVK